MNEVIAIRTAAGLSFYNPVERMHARAKQGLQGLGLMRTAMLADFEKIMKKCNSNDEVRQACQMEPHLKEALQNSLDTPIQLLKEIFIRLSMTQTAFRILDPASEGELDAFISNYDIFDNVIDNLTSKNKLKDFPRFQNFLETHTSSRTYSFHIFKCEDDSCIFHKPLRGPNPEPFSDPVPCAENDEFGSFYKEGYDPDEKKLPSKLKDVSKHNHNVPFTPTA